MNTPCFGIFPLLVFNQLAFKGRVIPIVVCKQIKLRVAFFMVIPPLPPISDAAFAILNRVLDDLAIGRTSSVSFKIKGIAFGFNAKDVRGSLTGTV